MFGVLYGEFAPHPWHDPEHDAYQLFQQLSLAMGWLDDRPADGPGEGRAPGLWSMNDAGRGHPLGAPGSDLVAWFQVEASAVACDRPLPVRPFLRCAQETTERMGSLVLSAVRVLLPVDGLDASARPPYAEVPSVLATHWFATAAPGSATPVEVTLGCGPGPCVAGFAQQLTASLTGLEQNVFLDVRPASADTEAALPPPPFEDDLWNGPAPHTLVWHGTLAEWTPDAIGWLAEVIADRAAAFGLSAPLLCTVRRLSQV
jgi:hypothetical protein